MKGFGIFLMILGGVLIFFTGIFGLILIVACFIFVVVGNSGNKEREEKRTRMQLADEEREKEYFIAKRTKELMETKGLSIMDAKTQAEMDYILEKNKR